MSIKELQAVLGEHVRAETAHELEATLATLHPECLFEDYAAGQTFHGRDGAARHYTQWWNAFDLLFSRGEHGSGRWVADGSYVAEGEFSGTHVGALAGLAPTGRKLRFRFCVFVSFRDGLLASERFYYDLATVAEQLAVDTGALRAAFAAAQSQGTAAP